MKRTIALAALLCSGCSMFAGLDTNNDSVMGVVDRGVLDNIVLNGTDTGKPVAGGIPINDAIVVSFGADMDRLFQLRIAEANGATVAAAITQATMATAITGMAVGGAPLAAAGGTAAASLFFQRIFGIANTPAKANAYLGGRDLLQAADTEFWTALAAETCSGSTRASGTVLTASGAQYLVRLRGIEVAVAKAIQNTIPTADQIQAATVPPQSVPGHLAMMAQPCEQVQGARGADGKPIFRRRAVEKNRN